MKKRAKYIMIGGFLGAGKTTSIQEFASYLNQKGLRVGLITNDQGAGLVDTAFGKANRHPVEEISGGCFCCRFQSLIEAATHLNAENSPDVFLAEPVGSCTDLVATVNLPLQQIYGDDYEVAPLSVLVDPVRALSILGIEDGRTFSDQVIYIYKKQLEEAEFIVVNKTDLLSEERKESLKNALIENYPNAQIFCISARHQEGLIPWFEAASEQSMNVERFLEIDYERYGSGEALLGWFNAGLLLESADEFDGNQLLNALAVDIHRRLEDNGAEVAHMKMLLTPQGDPFETAALNLVRGENSPELSHYLVDPLEDGNLLVNIRAEASPEVLKDSMVAAVSEVLESSFKLSVKITHQEHFRPGKPEPTHRFTKPSK